MHIENEKGQCANSYMNKATNCIRQLWFSLRGCNKALIRVKKKEKKKKKFNEEVEREKKRGPLLDPQSFLILF